MRAPRFWDGDLDPRSREAAPLTRLLLTPFAALYAGVTARRIRREEPLKLKVPVICVGNLTAGGTGKSPVTAALRDHIARLAPACRVATLSRGYGGKLKGPLEVDPAIHSASDVGDEALMHAYHAEAWIGADRASAGKAMQTAGVELIIMDDGHQNPSLHKDLSLVVVDSEAGFGNGFVIPKGPLREPVAAGLARAHGVILTGGAPAPEALQSLPLPLLRVEIAPVSPPNARRCVAFAGIGRPGKFFDTLEACGEKPVDAIPFPDHHVYSESDLTYLHALAAKHDAGLITTEKDFVRLRPAQRNGIEALPVRAVFDDIETLDHLLAPVTQVVAK